SCARRRRLIGTAGDRRGLVVVANGLDRRLIERCNHDVDPRRIHQAQSLILKIEEPVTQFRPHMGAERLRVAERVLDREVILERDFSLHAFSKEQWMRWGRRGAPSLCADKLAVASLRRGFAPGLAAAKFEA